MLTCSTKIICQWGCPGEIYRSKSKGNQQERARSKSLIVRSNGNEIEFVDLNGLVAFDLKDARQEPSVCR